MKAPTIQLRRPRRSMASVAPVAMKASQSNGAPVPATTVAVEAKSQT